MTTLLSPQVSDLLDRLLAEAAAGDQDEIDRAFASADPEEGWPDRFRMADLLAGAALPVSREVGQFLYQLVRATSARTVVEFGTSFGISTIQLAAAVLDAGAGGRVVTAELSEQKAARAQANLRAAGVADAVELRVGDALETLDDASLGPVDLVLLDGWKDLYLPMVRVLEPQLAPGALVIADDLLLFPEQISAYVAHVSDPRNGWLSVELPFDDGLLLSTWLGG